MSDAFNNAGIAYREENLTNHDRPRSFSGLCQKGFPDVSLRALGVPVHTRGVPLTLPAPAQVIRRAEADAESALATRRRTCVRQAVANADRKRIE